MLEVVPSLSRPSGPATASICTRAITRTAAPAPMMATFVLAASRRPFPGADCERTCEVVVVPLVSRVVGALRMGDSARTPRTGDGLRTPVRMGELSRMLRVGCVSREALVGVSLLSRAEKARRVPERRLDGGQTGGPGCPKASPDRVCACRQRAEQLMCSRFLLQ